MTVMHVDHGRPVELDVDIEPCKCGGQVKFALAYGSRPYCFYCEDCGNNYINDITCCNGERAIEYFNLYITDKYHPFTFKVLNSKEQS